MEAHPEGGWYAETYRAPGVIPKQVLPSGFIGDRNFATAIYFLLNHEQFSAFHRIKSDELWHFYDGDGLVVHELKGDGTYRRHLLGLDLDAGQRPQLCIEAKSWFASEVAESGSWCLVGCTVSPGFDFQDFELAGAAVLSRQFPDEKQLIVRLTRG